MQQDAGSRVSSCVKPNDPGDPGPGPTAGPPAWGVSAPLLPRAEAAASAL